MAQTELCRGPKGGRRPLVLLILDASQKAAASYHGELGLELDLQVLKRASQVGDLALAGLQLLRVGADLLPELPALPQQTGVRRGRERGLPAAVFMRMGQHLLFSRVYLFDEPGFGILPILLGDGFILRPHVVEELGEVHSGCSVHFYADLAWASRPEALELLGTGSEREGHRGPL